MPDGLAELIQGIGPLGAFCLAVLYLLMRNRKNNKAGNPGLSWQNDMKQAQNKANETLERMEKQMEKSVDLLNKMWGRQSGAE